MAKQYLLIGASAASFGALNSLRRSDPEARITIITAESEWPYNKCWLADYLAGSIGQEALSIYPTLFANVQLILGQKVVAIDAHAKSVITDTGNSLSYDALFLGMGSSPWILPIPGIDKEGIFTFHTNSDANAILASIKENKVKKVTVCGAGLSGLEAADALIKQGCQVTIIERSSQVLPWMLSKDAANFLHGKITQSGAQLMLNASMTEVISHNQKITGVSVNGQILPTNMLIVATGLRPNIQLCESAGILLDAHGVVVNEYMQTNKTDIYAGGDLIGVHDQLTGKKLRSCLWPDAMQQGMHAGMAMAGKPKAYGGITMITSTAFFGIKYASAGVLESPEGLIHKQSADYHHTFAVTNGALTAFQVLGNQHNLGSLRRMLLTKQPIIIDEL